MIPQMREPDAKIAKKFISSCAVAALQDLASIQC